MSELQAYEILVKEHENMVGAYVRGIVGDSALAKDITQEAFVRAYQKLSSFKAGSSFGAWIRTIARNLAIDHIRKNGREIAWDPELIQGLEDVLQPLEDPVRGEAWSDRVRTVETCFDSLPEILREPCRLYYYEESATAQIAETLRIGLDTVRKRLERARDLIKECFEKALALGSI